ncbi:hypothetical protein BV898_17727 [Hypsibius exemplaris]|uniref:G-protein coupled receptors family 1 profile domain-containing protein n=1 Tax=Hypsibius exemplaris TaxID=2072580 RepID=A0A9X6NFM1_HYPEX|nr:hypothetical protein BV898_17727 [Hypsibius exemplaris]
MLNVSLLAVIYSKKNLRAGAGLLISHLVVVDLLVILVAFPANISQTQNQPVSNFSCAAAQTFTYVLWCAKQYSILFLAINRVLALHVPRQYRIWSRHKNNIILIAVCWLIALIFGLPSNAGGVGGYWTAGPPWGSCTFRATPGGDNPFLMISSVFSRFLPVVTSTSIYFGMMVKAYFPCTGSQVNPQQQPYIHEATLRKRRAWAKVLAGMTVIETLCVFFPMMFQVKRDWILLWPPLGLWSRFMSMFSCIANPVTLFALSADYRKGFDQLYGKIPFPSISITFNGNRAAVAPQRTAALQGTSSVGISAPVGSANRPTISAPASK